MSDEPKVMPPPSAPMAVARRVVEDVYTEPGGSHAIVSWRGSFAGWDGRAWPELDERTIRSTAYKYLESAVYEAATPAGPVLKPWDPTRVKIANVIEALAAVAHLDAAVEQPSWLPVHDGPWTRPSPDHAATEYVACANGLLHVPTRTLHPHDPRFFTRTSVPFDSLADPPAPTEWLHFLGQLWPDDDDRDAIAALAEWFGYVMSGRRDLHKILLIIGPTRSGKGTIAHILEALVGRGNYAGPTLASLGTNFGLAPLIGKPLAVVSDARLGDQHVHQVVEPLLSISGEDALSIDVKFREAWTGTLPTRFVIISNELPRFGDASGAIANRFVILSLKESWLGREDHALTRKLLQELPGILSWSLDVLQRLMAAGRFTEPKSSADAIVALGDLVSPTSAFVRDMCVTGAGNEVPVQSLFHAWRTWALDNGHQAGSAATFGRNLRAVLPHLRVVRPRQESRERVYQGVAL